MAGINFFVLEAKKLSKIYLNNAVLNDVDFQVENREIVGIIGESGCGKTTLLNILSSLEQPDSGSVFIESIDICKLDVNALAIFRNRHIGIVFQFHNLLSEFSLLENVAMPAYIAGKNRTQANEKALGFMHALGIDHLRNHSISQLSGGQAQRAAFARAMINDPVIVFADEPSGSLDTKNANLLHELIFLLREKYNRSFIISTHNLDFANNMDRIVEIKANQLLNKKKTLSS